MLLLIIYLIVRCIYKLYFIGNVIVCYTLNVERQLENIIYAFGPYGLLFLHETPNVLGVGMKLEHLVGSF